MSAKPAIYTKEIKTIYKGTEYTGELIIKGTRTIYLTIKYKGKNGTLKKDSHRGITDNSVEKIEYEGEQIFQELLSANQSSL